MYYEFMPRCTHARVVNIQYEVERPAENKPGYIDVWLAKGFIVDDQFREAPGVPGINVRLEITPRFVEEFADAELDIISTLIDRGSVSGKVDKGPGK
jgi:hypothetical protein